MDPGENVFLELYMYLMFGGLLHTAIFVALSPPIAITVAIRSRNSRSVWTAAHDVLHEARQQAVGLR